LFVFNNLNRFSFRRFRGLFDFNNLAPLSFRRATATLGLWTKAREGRARQQGKAPAGLSTFLKHNTMAQPAWEGIVGFLHRTSARSSGAVAAPREASSAIIQPNPDHPA
jgi:hypothetical protein